MISNSTKNKVTKGLTACVLALGLLVGFGEKAAHAASGKVLILDKTVSGGAGSVEAVEAAALGYGVDVVSDAQWAAMSTADFASYKAVILGDPTCSTTPGYNMAAAEANTAVWGPAVTGNMIVIGTDEVYHGKTQVTFNGIKFATDGATTGLFVSLSCYYYAAAPTTVPVLSYFGSFVAQATPAGCFAPVHIVAVHPALAGLTDAYLTGWGCSTHETFESFPTGTFVPLAIAIGPGAGAITSADGVTGVPYILARGAVPVLCGDGVVQATEGCDHGSSNGTCGDTCSPICKLHWCGDGVVDSGEDCDLGCSNGVPGSTCSTTCKTIVSTVTPPSCALTAVVAGPPKELDITVQDSADGIATVEVTDSTNASVTVPSFSSGEKGALVVTALKIDQTAGAHVALKITDVAGAVTLCDPVVPGDPPNLTVSVPSDSAGGCNVGRINGATGLPGLLGVLVGLALLRRRAVAQKK